MALCCCCCSELNKNRVTSIDGLTFEPLRRLETLRLRRNNITQLKDGCFFKLDRLRTL